MTRKGWVKPQRKQRLTDHIALGVLTATYLPSVIDSIILALDKQEQRHRLLPARLVMYYVIALALFADSAYEEVMRSLVEGLSWQSGWKNTWTVPTPAAITLARARLGYEPLKALFDQECTPLGTENTPGVMYRRWRLMAIDGTTLDVADTPENVEAFERPVNTKTEKSAYPKVRIVGLAECGTHALTGMALGKYNEHETVLTRKMLDEFQPGMLIFADRGFMGYPLFSAAAAQGCDLCWRARSPAKYPVKEELSDGSYLSEIFDFPDRRFRKEHPLPVRVIRYRVDDPGKKTEQEYRLVTTILDPEEAPANELAELYAERWEIESLFDELKTHQRGRAIILRSKPADGVRQEVYGYVLAHYAVRALISTAADDHDVDPDRIGFTRTLRAARRSIRAGIGTSAQGIAKAVKETVTEICSEFLPVRKLRAAARVVKRGVTHYPVKHSIHSNWPQPTLQIAAAISVVPP